MLLVRADAADVGLAERHAAAQVEAVPPLAVGLVVLEADERQRANVHLLHACRRAAARSASGSKSAVFAAWKK